jgi:hypothetical protein
MPGYLNWAAVPLPSAHPAIPFPAKVDTNPRRHVHSSNAKIQRIAQVQDGAVCIDSNATALRIELGRGTISVGIPRRATACYSAHDSCRRDATHSKVRRIEHKHIASRIHCGLIRKLKLGIGADTVRITAGGRTGERRDVNWRHAAGGGALRLCKQRRRTGYRWGSAAGRRARVPRRAQHGQRGVGRAVKPCAPCQHSWTSRTSPMRSVTRSQSSRGAHNT